MLRPLRCGYQTVSSELYVAANKMANDFYYQRQSLEYRQTMLGVGLQLRQIMIFVL